MDARLQTTPVSELIGIIDVARLLGVKRQTVDLWRVRDRRGRTVAEPLPEPLVPNERCTSTCPLWSRSEILAWAKASGRLDGDRSALAR